jgi:hypothetical protein
VSENSDLVRTVETCWDQVRADVAALDLAMRVYPDPLWTVRDVLIHCAFWNDEATKAIEAFQRGETYLTDTGAATFDEGLDALNSRVVDASRQLPEDEVRRTWMAAQDRFTDAVRGLDPDVLGTEMTCPWNERDTVAGMVRDEIGHETDHINDVLTAVSGQEETG